MPLSFSLGVVPIRLTRRSPHQKGRLRKNGISANIKADDSGGSWIASVCLRTRFGTMNPGRYPSPRPSPLRKGRGRTVRSAVAKEGSSRVGQDPILGQPVGRYTPDSSHGFQDEGLFERGQKIGVTREINKGAGNGQFRN